MAQVRYAPGDATAVVTGNGVALIAAELPAALVDRIWAQLDDGRGLAVVLEALTGVFGTSLTAIPPFAVALAEGSAVRLAARGPMSIAVESSSGSDTVSGAGVTTWSERVVDGVTAFRMLSGAQASGTRALPIRDGVVLAAEVVVDRAGAALDDPIARTAAEGAFLRAESAVVPREGAVVPAESAVVPRGGAVVPREGAVVPAESAVVPREGAVVPREGAFRGDERAPGAPGRAAAVPLPPGRLVESATPTDTPSGLIDSSAVLSITTADTLLPNESTFAPGLTGDESAEPSASSDEAGAVETPWDATMLRLHEGTLAPDEGTLAAEGGTLAADEGTLAPDEGTLAPEAGTPAADEGTLAAEEGTLAAGGAASVPPAGDHDGLTISLAEARAQRTGTTDSAPPPLAPARPTAIGRLSLSTGQVVLLDRTVVIGRRPRSTRVTGTDLPHLIVVDSPQQDISRSHVEVRTEGDSILVTDLHTTNGTTLLRSGSDPVRLHPGERTIVVVGDRVDLGDGVVVTVEDAS